MNGLTVACTARVTLTPEQRLSRRGKHMLSFSAVVDQNFTATEDRAVPEPIFLRVTAWEATAEQLADELQKGNLVYVEGRLTHGTWQGPDGRPRCGLNVSAWRVEIHGALGRQSPPRAARQDDGYGRRGNSTTEDSAGEE